MDLTDMGAELWGLVYHLFSTRGKSSFEELRLRTGVAYSASDHELEPITLSNLKSTAWYQEMCQRYKKQQEIAQVQHKDRFEEVDEMVQLLYPKGCALSEYAESVHSCVSMYTFTIPEPLVSAFLQRQDEVQMKKTTYSVSAEELTEDLRSLVQESVFPKRWWTAGDRTSARATRIGLLLQPPRIEIEYEVQRDASPQLRHRRIHLPPNVLDANHPVSAISRRLAHSHGMLLSETAFQKVILDLQRYAQAKREDQKLVQEPAVELRSEGKRDAAPHAAAPPPASSKPQAADLCLLYRDPEAALVNVDLNHADDDTVKEFKEVMDIKFKEHALKPGDPGYEYDKRVEVQPTEKSEWDDSDEDEDSF